MNSIIKGFFSPNVPPQKRLRTQLEDLGQAKCWELLKSCDPISTKKINFADHIRTIRALEVFYITGEPFSSQQFHITTILVKRSKAIHKKLHNVTN